MLAKEIAKHRQMNAALKKRASAQDTVDQINEKARKLQAEKDIQLVLYKQKMKAQSEMSFNPFSRKDCRPTNMWDSA